MIDDPVFKITSEGVQAPSYTEVLDYLKGEARRIFGDDINLDADTQDGQLLAIFASAIHDVNSQAVATYNSFSPKTAKGSALDTVVAVNGLTRQLPTYSHVDLTLIGQAGTEISNGYATDAFNNKWLLPEYVVIPLSGEITVNAIAEKAGEIKATPNSITKIGTPTRGWQQVTNRESASPGVKGETDDELRVRQAKSTALPSMSLWDGIIASLGNIEGVTRVAGQRNDTSKVDAFGIPPHSIAMIVDGGDVSEIAKTIFLKKGEGVGTFGDVETVYIDRFDYPNRVYFSRPKIVNVAVTLSILPSATYLSSVADELKQRIADYINKLPIGTYVNAGRLLTCAVKTESGLDERFDASSLKIGKVGGTLEQRSLPIKWNEAPSISLDDITIEVVTQ